MSQDFPCMAVAECLNWEQACDVAIQLAGRSGGNGSHRLEAMLLEFDQTWSPQSLNEAVGRLESSPDADYRRLVLAELVKVDLQRSWAKGEGRILEEYLATYPSLGSAETVRPDLIVVEFAARRVVDTKLDLQSYRNRFPSQFNALTELVAEIGESQVAEGERRGPDGELDRGQGQASIETSRAEVARDTGHAGLDRSRRPEQDELPVEFGRYRILRKLGSGAMGKVYLALDTQLDRQVAIKTPSFRDGGDGELIARFHREARSAARIHHRNICPVYDVGEIEGRHFISMGYIQGRPLSDFIVPNRLPPTRTSAILIHRLAVALAEAHRHNVVHRDLKPANIMVNRDREPVVMDFGLARQTDSESRVTQSGTIVGTPAYMSPEQLGGDPGDVGPASDIYSLGVILYEMLTGTIPFRGSIASVVYKIMHEEPVAPSQLRDGLDSQLESICTKMMAKDRAERFPSMGDVAAALKRYLLASKTKSERAADQSESKPQSAAGPVAVSGGEQAEAVPEARGSSGEISETDALNLFFAAIAAESRQSGLQQASAKLKRSRSTTATGRMPLWRANLPPAIRRCGRPFWPARSMWT